MRDNPVVLNPIGCYIKKTEDKSEMRFTFDWRIPMPECFDSYEYIVIRVSDLDKKTSQKLSTLLQGKFTKRTNG